jgi:hypothetical protein
MSPYDEVYARLKRIRALWRELQRTPKSSSRYDVLIKEIHAESSAYSALVNAQGQKKTGGHDK